MYHNDDKKYFEIRAFPNKEDKYDEFINEKIICLGWPEIGNLQDLIVNPNKKELLKELLLEKYPSQFKSKPGYLTQVSTFFSRFLEMNVGDIILIPYNDRSELTICTVSSTYKFVDTKDVSHFHMKHQIEVDNIVKVPMGDLSLSLKNRLGARLTLTRIYEDKFNEINRLYHHKKTNDTDLDATIANINLVKDEFNETVIKIQNSDDDKYQLISKSLLLAGFSLLEGYLTDIINTRVDQIDSHSSDLEDNLITSLGIEELQNKHAKANTSGWCTKIELFHLLFTQKHKESDRAINKAEGKQKNIRNALAHDITTAQIFSDDGGKNFQINLGGENKNEEFLGDVFEALSNCAKAFSTKSKLN